MAPGDNSSPIVETRPGNATGESWIKTADGRWWKVVPYLTEPGTGDRQGYTDGKSVWPK